MLYNGFANASGRALSTAEIVDDKVLQYIRNTNFILKKMTDN